VFCRFALIPRAWAAFGMAAAVLLIAAIAMSVFGHAFAFPMLIPLGLSQLALVAWLLLKGFADARQPLHAKAPSTA
jgi:Sec-independent protein secretion pathway component TatC